MEGDFIQALLCTPFAAVQRLSGTMSFIQFKVSCPGGCLHEKWSEIDGSPKTIIRFIVQSVLNFVGLNMA